MKNQISILFIPQTLTIPFSKKWLKDVANKIINLLTLHKIVELSVVITDNYHIKNLNSIYRGVNEPTDVLAFHMPSEDMRDNKLFFISPPDSLMHLGDVIISIEMAQDQANQYSCSIKQEVARLLLHGILHLLNYDHELPNDRKLMEKKEREIFNKLNITD